MENSLRDDLVLEIFKYIHDCKFLGRAITISKSVQPLVFECSSLSINVPLCMSKETNLNHFLDCGFLTFLSRCQHLESIEVIFPSITSDEAEHRWAAECTTFLELLICIWIKDGGEKDRNHLEINNRKQHARQYFKFLQVLYFSVLIAVKRTPSVKMVSISNGFGSFKITDELMTFLKEYLQDVDNTQLIDDIIRPNTHIINMGSVSKEIGSRGVTFIFVTPTLVIAEKEGEEECAQQLIELKKCSQDFVDLALDLDDELYRTSALKILEFLIMQGELA